MANTLTMGERTRPKNFLENIFMMLNVMATIWCPLNSDKLAAAVFRVAQVPPALTASCDAVMGLRMLRQRVNGRMTGGAAGKATEDKRHEIVNGRLRELLLVERKKILCTVIPRK